jgi:hypothetical protein
LLNSAFGRNNGASARRQGGCRPNAPYLKEQLFPTDPATRTGDQVSGSP